MHLGTEEEMPVCVSEGSIVDKKKNNNKRTMKVKSAKKKSPNKFSQLL